MINLTVVIDNEEALRKFRELQKVAKVSTSAMVTDFDTIETAIDAFTKKINENKTAIEEQKQSIKVNQKVIKELSAEYQKVKEALSNAPTNKMKEVLSAQLEQVADDLAAERTNLEQNKAALQAYNDELDKSKTALQKSKAELKAYERTQNSIRAQLMSVRNEMQQLELSGQKNSIRYKELQGELQRLGTAYRKVTIEQRNLTTGATQWAGLQSALQGVLGVFATGQGVIGLFTDKSEELVKIQTRLQSIMAIIMGMSQVSNTLHETSAFRVTTLTKATDLWSAANLRVGKTLISMGMAANTARIAAIALNTVITLGIGAAIGVAIGWITKLVNKHEAAKKAAEESATKQREAFESYASSVASNASKTITKFKSLQQAYNALGDDMQAKTKFIKENKSAFDELGVSITGAKDADNLFIDNAEAFVASVELRARAAAAMEIASEKYKQSIEKMMEAEKVKQGEISYYDESGRLNVDGLNAEQRKGLYKAVSNAKEQKRGELRGKNLKTEDFNNEINAAAREAIKNYFENISHFNSLSKQIENEASLLESEASKAISISIEQSKAAAKIFKKGGFTSNDARAETEVKNQNKLAELILAGDLALQQSRIDIMKDGLEKELAQIDLNTEKKVQAIEEERKQELKARELEPTGKLPDDREAKYAELTANAQKEGDEASIATKLKYAKELDTIYKQITDSSLTEEERRVRGIKDKYAGLREWVKKALEGGTITQEQASALGLKIDQAETVDTLKGIIDAYGTAEDKITKIQQEAESARKTAREQGRDDLISQIDKQEQEDIGAIKAEELMKTDDWINLFQNLDALSSKEIRRIIDNINDQLKNANLDPINLKTITDQLQKASDTATKKNPFAGIINGFKDLKKARQDADNAREKYNKEQTEENKQASNQADIEVIEKRKKAWLAAAEGIEIARTALEGVTSIAEMFGADEDTVGVLNDVTGAIGGIGTAVQGFASGNIAQGIQGVFSALGSIFNIFSGDRKKERNIKRLQEQVEALEKSYDKLGDAVERSYSKDAKGLIEDQNELLKQQKVLIEQQIKEEQSKKKSDKDRIKEWEEQLEEINQKIKENKEAALDALFGEDVKSQIDNFANALIEAWEAGDSKAKASKDIVKSMIKNMITEAMKMDISPFMDNLRAKMEEFWNDNIISQQEEEILNQMANEQAKNLSNKYAWADRFFNEENKTGQEATYGGYETLSEDTGQKLDGRFAAIQMIAEDIKEYSRQSIGINSDNKGLLEKNNLVSIDIRDIQVEQLNYLKIISSNTDRLEAVEKYLGKICKYTKNLE